MAIYHMINWFFAFSMLGYLLECVVLSFENRRMIVNRGFGHGPFCIIYGFGAMGAYLILEPLADSYVKLYLASMLMATFMELFTAAAMIRLFGSFWWDYSKKPFNYRGIICLESSLGWGILGIFFFRFLDGFVHHLVSYIPTGIEKYVALGLLIFYLADFTYTLRVQMRDSDDDDETPMVGRLKVY